MFKKELTRLKTLKKYKDTLLKDKLIYTLLIESFLKDDACD